MGQSVPRYLNWMVVLLLAGCGGAERPVEQNTVAPPASNPQARTLTIGITQYPSTLHPTIEAMVAKYYVLGMTMRPLTRFNADWQLECSLCVTLPTLDNGMAVLETTPDGQPGIAVTWEIPAGATWGDGVPVTSRDAVFMWEVGRHPLSGVNGSETYRSIYAIDVIDDKHFTFHSDRRTFNYNAYWTLYLLPEHLERAIFERAPAEYMHNTTYDADPTNAGLYYGPYRISATERGSHITLVRNSTWYGKQPYFDEITVRAIERTTTLEANLLSGTIDMIAGELGMQLDQALAFDRRHGNEFNVIYNPGLLYEHIDLNLHNPILADVRVRRALMYALDREQINLKLFDGRQPVANTNVHPMDRQATDAVPKYSLDLPRAGALLDEAGWTMGKDGFRHNSAGETLRLEIASTAGDKTRELVEQVLQSQWKAAGIDLRIKNVAPRIFFGETTRRREFPAMAMYAWANAPESSPRTVLHSSQIPTPENNFSGQNYSGFTNPEVDGLIEAIENELDPAARLPLWYRLQEIYASQLPVLPLFFRANSYILPKWLHGVVPTGNLTESTEWVEYWGRGE